MAKVEAEEAIEEVDEAGVAKVEAEEEEKEEVEGAGKICGRRSRIWTKRMLKKFSSLARLKQKHFVTPFLFSMLFDYFNTQDKNSALSQIVQKDEEAFLQRHFNGDILSVKIEEDKDFSLKEVEGISSPRFPFEVPEYEVMVSCSHTIVGDLFSSTDSLAHCVSEDFAMSKGVAVGFRDSFGGVDDLLSQNVQAGGLGVLSRDDRWVFYLVTKEA